MHRVAPFSTKSVPVIMRSVSDAWSQGWVVYVAIKTVTEVCDYRLVSDNITYRLIK